MEVAVWDTWVKRSDGRLMNFDIIVPRTFTDATKIFSFGTEYLASKGMQGKLLSSAECRFCHVQVALPEWISQIKELGYYICELQGCE
ncbi:MAG: DUF2024 family protein [Flammeovirgaceae bacterium]|nr:MAG: DUF2024 family protein [Flammeovirgaceae bacterium]